MLFILCLVLQISFVTIALYNGPKWFLESARVHFRPLSVLYARFYFQSCFILAFLTFCIAFLIFYI